MHSAGVRGEELAGAGVVVFAAAAGAGVAVPDFVLPFVTGALLFHVVASADAVVPIVSLICGTVVLRHGTVALTLHVPRHIHIEGSGVCPVLMFR